MAQGSNDLSTLPLIVFGICWIISVADNLVFTMNFSPPTKVVSSICLPLWSLHSPFSLVQYFVPLLLVVPSYQNWYFLSCVDCFVYLHHFLHQVTLRRPSEFWWWLSDFLRLHNGEVLNHAKTENVYPDQDRKQLFHRPFFFRLIMFVNGFCQRSQSVHDR